MQANGVYVEFDNRTPTTPPDEDGMAVDNPQVNTRTPTVPIDPSQPAIYWCSWGGNGIHRANLDGSNVNPLVNGVFSWELILDVAGGKIYWISQESIQRANLDGSNVETLRSIEAGVRHLTLDITGRKMYWISGEWDEDGYPLWHKIQRANLNGSNIETLKAGKWDAWDLTLDASSGKIYWIDRADQGLSGPSKIQCANLDGSNVQTLVREHYLSALTLDISSGKMYWRKIPGDDIQCANLDGSNVQTLVTGADLYKLTLDVAGGKMYWTAYDRDRYSWPSKIQCANLDGSNVQTLVMEEYTIRLTLDVAGGKMYWAGRNGDDFKIQRANLDGSNIEDIVTGLDQITFVLIPSQALADDMADDTVPSAVRKTTQVHVDAADRPPMYWTDYQVGTLHRLVGAEVENLAPSVRKATGLTLDVVNDKLYWTEKTHRSGKIRSANLDGTNVRLVKDLTSVPLDITLDAANGKLYLTNAWGKVQRLNVDGSRFQPNLITDLETPMNIIVDGANEKLYWTEQTGKRSGRIRSANLDGTNVRLVRDFKTSLPLDMTLDAADGKFYLTNAWGKVQRMNLDGSGFQPNFITGLDKRMNIAVDTAGRKLYLTSSDGKISRLDVDGMEGDNHVEEVITGLGNPGRLVLGVTVDQMAATPAPGPAEVLKLSAAQIAHIGEQITFNLNIVGGEAVASYQITVQFDETALRYVSSANGDYLPAGAFFLPPTVDGNRVTLGADAVTGESNGDGTLATLTFEVIAVKASTLTLSEVILANSAGEYNDNFDDLQLVLDNPGRNPYDINGDGTVNDTDASLVSEAISNGSTDAKYDVNDDGKVNFDDLQLVLDNRDRNPYDINGDGTVDDEDASLLTEAISNGSTDAKYDVNDDGKVNFDDLQLVLDNRAPGATEAPPIVGNLKLNAAQMARIEAQIDLLLATGDRSPAAIRTLIYLQQLLTTARPEETRLLTNYPNPFNPETWLPYQLSTGSDVRITIYDMSGKVVRRLVLGYQSAGYYTSRSRAAYWDGRNAQGESVASGLYFYTFTAGDFTATRKMLIVK